MKKALVFALAIGMLMAAIPAFSLDYGTKVALPFTGTDTERFWKTNWSPDGKWITFGAGDDIWIVSVQDATVINLTGEIDDLCRIPAFTPDGNEVMFSRMFTNSDTKRLQSVIESVNIESGESRVVREEAFAGSMSRDGKFLVYVYWPDPGKQENMTHVLYNVDDDEITYYNFWTDYPFFNFGHSCMSPDNTNFVTTLVKVRGSMSDNPDALYRISLDGNEVEELVSDGDPWYPEYSPDGKWILYTRFDYAVTDETRNVPRGDLYVYNCDTGEILNLLPDNPYNSICGSWSPDGRKICYILDTKGSYELYIRDFEFAAPDIQLEVHEESPSPFALIGNYPNPFNPTTTIEFSLPEAGFTELVIYNVMGQKIRGLVAGSMTPGVHSVVWDGRDNLGQAVSAGVYVTRLQMHDAISTGRMTLVK